MKLQFCFMYVSQESSKNLRLRFAKILPTAFLTRIKTRKGKEKKRRKKKRIFSLLIFMLV